MPAESYRVVAGARCGPIGYAAEHRYLFDAEFHAKVDTIVKTIQAEAGLTFDENDRSLATFAAAVALNFYSPVFPLGGP